MPWRSKVFSVGGGLGRQGVQQLDQHRLSPLQASPGVRELGVLENERPGVGPAGSPGVRRA